MDIREILAEHFESTAAWRASVQERYPDDLRNGACADALTSLAEYTRTMPETEAAPFVKLAIDNDAVLFCLLGDSEHVSPVIGRYGFDGRPESPSAFLTRLAALMREVLDADEARGYAE